MTSISAPKCSGVLALLTCTAALISCQFAFGDFHVEHTAQGGSSAWDQSSGGAPTDAASGEQSADAMGSMGGSSVSGDSGDAFSAGGSGGFVGTASGGSTANESLDAEVGR